MSPIPITRGPTTELAPGGSNYPLPTTPQILTVTPDMASDWLSYRNHPKNRPLSRGVAAKYQRDMEAGRWREETPEGYIFDTGGYIISAQHRLKAQANSDTTLNMWIFPDQPRDIFDVVDQGYKRTAAHLLQMPYATSVGTAARYLAALSDRDRWGLPRFPKVTTPEIVATAHAWPEITWWIKELHRTCLETAIPIGPHAAVLAQAARSTYRDRIPAWVEGVQTGENLSRTDPRLQLRRRFIGGLPTGKGRRDQAYALIVKAWNAFARDEELPLLRHMHTEVLPKVEDFDFTKGRAAA